VRAARDEVREGFQSIEHVKRYTTTGMATDQGKTSNLNAMAIVAQTLAIEKAPALTPRPLPLAKPTLVQCVAPRSGYSHE